MVPLGPLSYIIKEGELNGGREIKKTKRERNVKLEEGEKEAAL